jgi:carboxypeptidase T
LKSISIFVLLLILIVSISNLFADNSQINRYRVYANSKEKVDLLLIHEVEIVATKFGETIDIRCSKEKASSLKKLGFKIELVRNYDQISFDVPPGFHNYQETKEFLQQRNNVFGDITKLDSIGTSVENRAIWAMKISDNPENDEDEPCLLVEGCIHGNENHALEACLFFIDYILNNYGIDQEVTHWVNNREIWVVPLVNPDGHELNQRRNVNNVDLNRNFGYWWGFSASAYGSVPFSEPETKQFATWLSTLNRTVLLRFTPRGVC